MQTKTIKERVEEAIYHKLPIIKKHNLRKLLKTIDKVYSQLTPLDAYKYGQGLAETAVDIELELNGGYC